MEPSKKTTHFPANEKVVEIIIDYLITDTVILSRVYEHGNRCAFFILPWVAVNAFSIFYYNLFSTFSVVQSKKQL